MTLREDIVDYFIQMINDRCFDHDIVQWIKPFDPRTWKNYWHYHGLQSFVHVFLNDMIDKLVAYWPRIDAEKAKLGLSVVKQYFVDYLMMNDKMMEDMTLTVFGCEVVRRWQFDRSMAAVRELFASMIAIMPTAMPLENWNSYSTLIWGKHSKSTSCQSIKEVVNVKCNGPPQSKYDPRPLALKMTQDSRIRQIDLSKHTSQPHIIQFFKAAKQNDLQSAQQAIDELENMKIPIRNIKNMKRLKKNMKKKILKPRKDGSYQYQSNITEFMQPQNKKRIVTVKEQLFSNYCIWSFILEFIAKGMDNLRRGKYELVSYNLCIAVKWSIARMQIDEFYDVSIESDFVLVWSPAEFVLYHSEKDEAVKFLRDSKINKLSYEKSDFYGDYVESVSEESKENEAENLDVHGSDIEDNEQKEIEEVDDTPNGMFIMHWFRNKYQHLSGPQIYEKLNRKEYFQLVHQICKNEKDASRNSMALIFKHEYALDLSVKQIKKDKRFKRAVKKVKKLYK